MANVVIKQQDGPDRGIRVQIGLPSFTIVHDSTKVWTCVKDLTNLFVEALNLVMLFLDLDAEPAWA